MPFSHATRLYNIARFEGTAAAVSAIAEFAEDTSRTTILEKIHLLRYGGQAYDPKELIRIDPADVNLIQTPHFHTDYTHETSHIFGGDWDQRRLEDELYLEAKHEYPELKKRTVVPVEEYKMFQAFRQHFDRGVDWDKTDFYDWVVKTDKTGEYSVEKFEEVDALYDSLREQGYQMQQDLLTDSESDSNFDEVKVNIGRDGEIILDDGRHRLFLARILGITDIPVRVFVRHKNWQETRSEVLAADNRDSIPQVVQNRLDHPDLKELVNC